MENNPIPPHLKVRGDWVGKRVAKVRYLFLEKEKRTTIKSPLPEGGGDLVKGKIGDTRYI